MAAEPAFSSRVAAIGFVVYCAHVLCVIDCTDWRVATIDIYKHSLRRGTFVYDQCGARSGSPIAHVHAIAATRDEKAGSAATLKEEPGQLLPKINACLC